MSKSSDIENLKELEKNSELSKINLSNQKEEKETKEIKLPEKKKRLYGIDLLRIYSMFMVIIFHYVQYCNFETNNIAYKFKRYFFYFLRNWGLCCNQIFGFISGYIGVNSSHKLQTLILLIISVTIYSVIIEFYCVIKEKRKYTIFQYILIFFPMGRNLFWYYSTYSALFFFMPYINLVVKNVGKIESQKICFIMFVLFNCIVPIFNTYVFGFKCNTLVMLSMDYYYGAHIQLYGVFIEKYRKIFLVLIMIICNIFNTFLLYLNDVNINHEKKLFSLEGFKFEYNLFVIIRTFCYICIFKDLNLCNLCEKIIKLITPSVFYIYILGFNQYNYKIYKDQTLSVLKYFEVIYTLLYKSLFLWMKLFIIDYIRRLIFDFLKIQNLARMIANKIEWLTHKCFKDNSYEQINKEENLEKKINDKVEETTSKIEKN